MCRLRPVTLLLCLCIVAMRGRPVLARADSVQVDRTHKVEASLALGPMLSKFRETPPYEGASHFAWGYNAIARVVWHPGNVLGVGLLSGHITFISQELYLPDSASDGLVHARLSAVPTMIDVTAELLGFDCGLGLGGYVVSTLLTDVTTARASRFELGILGHFAYRWQVGDHVSIGPELLVNYLSYRGIFSASPHLSLEYDILAY